MYKNKDADIQAEGEEKVIGQLDAAHIEDEENGKIGVNIVDRNGAKFYILLILLELYRTGILQKLSEEKGDEKDPTLEGIRNIIRDLRELQKKKMYTNPVKQQGLNFKGNGITLESQAKENHILGTLEVIFFKNFPSEKSSEYDFDINIAFQKIAKLKKRIEEKDNEDGTRTTKIIYEPNNALEEIINFLPEFYRGNKLVLEVVDAIRSGDQGKIELLIKKIIAFLTAEVEEKEKKINNKKIVEKIITCNSDSNPRSKKKSFISSVTIGGIEFKRENIKVQEEYGDDIQMEEKNQISYFRQPGPDGKMKRYIINKDTNFIFEMPDKGFDELDDKDKVRLYDASHDKWYDDRHYAVASKIKSYYSGKDGNKLEETSSNKIVFSFYDEDNKQCVQLSPFSNKVCISDYSHDKTYQSISKVYSSGSGSGVAIFNEKLDSIIRDIESGKLKDNKSIDFACKNIGIIVEANPMIASGAMNRLEMLEIIRKYGPFNMISPIRPPDEQCFKDAKEYALKVKDLFHAKKNGWLGIKFGSGRDDSDVKKVFTGENIINNYGYDIGNEDNDETRRKAIGIEHFLNSTKPKSISVVEYKDGKEIKTKNIENINKKSIEDQIGFTVGESEEGECSYSRKILDKQNEAEMSNCIIEEELNNPLVRRNDLSKHAYLDYEKSKEREKLREEKNKKNKTKSNNKETNYEESLIQLCIKKAAISINNALKGLSQIKRKSLFEKILCFLGIMKDYSKEEYNSNCAILEKNIGLVKINPEQAQNIQEIVDNGAIACGERRRDITRHVNLSLDSVNDKEKGIK